MWSNKSNTTVNSNQVEEYDDGRIYDSKAVRLITQSWIEKKMKERESEFTENVKASIFCGTWNVNAKKEEGSLNDWILPKNSKISQVYAIGFQEIVDLNAVNVAFDTTKSYQRSQYWHDQILECLNSTGSKFSLVSKSNLVGLCLFVFVNDDIIVNVKDVRSSSTSCGFGGMMANKGGISIRLSLYDSSICFVCAHLAAHRENVVGRNNDYKSIIDRTVFTSYNSSSGNLNAYELNNMELNSSTKVIRPRNGAEKSYGNDVMILDHDIVFFIGDLNYRLEEAISTDDALTLLSTLDPYSVNTSNDTDEKWLALRDYDQLNIERKKNNVFRGFNEGELCFLPTYKYQPGTNLYEQRPDKKLRAPAWCDRILWRVSNPSNKSTGTINIESSVNLMRYNRSEGLLASDHKPVYALFDCELKSIIKQKENEVFNKYIIDLEYWANSNIPEVSCSSEDIQIGKVFYEVPVEIPLVITNTGKTIVYWHFLTKLDEFGISKSWIKVSLKSGLLLPNETATITITVKVDKLTSQSINAGKDILQDIIALRIENAKDKYISITGDFQRSCFGVSIQELVYTLEPIRQTRFPVQIPTVDDSNPTNEYSFQKAQSSGENTYKQSIPKELWRIMDALWSKNVINDSTVFLNSSDDLDVNEIFGIRESLDCGTDFHSNASLISLFEVLISFIEALPTPIVMCDLLPNSPLDDSSIRSWSRRFLESLPSLHYNVFVYVLSFMRDILSHSRVNKSKADFLVLACVRGFCPRTSIFYVNIPRDERIKREQRLGYFEDVLMYMLTTSTI